MQDARRRRGSAERLYSTKTNDGARAIVRSEKEKKDGRRIINCDTAFFAADLTLR
jgi:hypothetical protein